MSVTSSPEPRYCARGEECVWYARAGGPGKLGNKNPDHICEQCREADFKALQKASQRGQAGNAGLLERDEFENLRAGGQRVLISKMVDEMQQLMRDWVCESFTQRGPFWDEISAMRATWEITPSRQAPPADRFPTSTYYPEHWTREPSAPTGDWRYKFKLARWNAELKSISDRTVPEKYRVRTGDWPGYSRWVKFISACVMYDPPRDSLLEFASSVGLGAGLHWPWPPDLWEDYDLEDVPWAVGLPIRMLQDPDKAEAIERRRWQRYMEALVEHMESLGIDGRAMLREVRQNHPEIEKEYQEARWNNYKRPHVDLEEVTAQELRLVSSAIPQRASRETKTKPPRDRLTCLQAAIFRQDGWSEEQIAEWLGGKTEATARNYINDGFGILEQTSE